MNDLVQTTEGQTLKAKISDPQEQMREIIKCKMDFTYFCSNYVRILALPKGLIPFNLFGFQKRVFKEYESHRFNIIRKFRQGGLSTITAIYALWKILFFNDQGIFVISKGDREALNFHKIIRQAWNYLPDWMQCEVVVENKHQLALENGSSVECHTPKAGRSFTAGKLIIDEAAFVPDMDDIWASVYPTVSTGGGAIVISTVCGIGNWYHQTWVGAESGQNKFNPIRCHYTEHPYYNNPEWVDSTFKQLGEKRWKQEVLGEFLGSANTYLPDTIIKEYLDKVVEPLEEKLDGALKIFAPPKPEREYILGCDPSDGIGEDSDFACIEVIDAENLEQVAEFYSNTYPPKKFAQVVASLGRLYNYGLVVVESNKGIAVIESLTEDMHYTNLYWGSPITKKNKPRIGFNSNVRTRKLTQEIIYHIVSNKLIKIHSKILANEFTTWLFNSSSQKAEHARGYHDDAIMALGLALIVRDDIEKGRPIFYREGEENSPKDQPLSTYIEEKDLSKEIEGDKKEDEDTLPPIEDTGIFSKDEIIELYRPEDELLREFGF